jgi:hypothetical protein
LRERPIEQTAPPRLLTRADCAWRGAGIFAGTSLGLVAVASAIPALCLSENPHVINTGVLLDWLPFLATFLPPFAVLGVLLGWYHCESVQPDEEAKSYLDQVSIWLLLVPRSIVHSPFYTHLAILCTGLMVPVVLVSALLKALSKGASPSWQIQRLAAPLWTLVAFLAWPRAGALYEDDERTSLTEFVRNLAFVSPLPILLIVLLTAWISANEDQYSVHRQIALLWPLFTFWLGDYLLLWHVLRLHAAGRLAVAEWSPRFSLRALVLAVLAWGAWLTALTWVWRE